MAQSPHPNKIVLRAGIGEKKNKMSIIELADRQMDRLSTLMQEGHIDEDTLLSGVQMMQDLLLKTFVIPQNEEEP